MAAGEIIVKKYVNIGVAVDTDRGLLVPVIRDADQKNIVQLSVELAQLSEKARNRKIALDEMQGGCFSISNLGGIGGTYFTPIVNAPEVAILGISRARHRAGLRQGDRQFAPRFMLPLSLSYDHRVDRRRRRHPFPALGLRSARETRSCSRSRAERCKQLRPAVTTKTQRHETIRSSLRALRVLVSSWSGSTV